MWSLDFIGRMACSIVCLIFWLLALFAIPSIFAHEPYASGFQADNLTMVVMYGIFGPLTALVPWAYSSYPTAFHTGKSLAKEDSHRTIKPNERTGTGIEERSNQFEVKFE